MMKKNNAALYKMLKCSGIYLMACLLLLCGSIGIFAVHASESFSGACGENLTWTLEDGTLLVSGSGAMEDYSVLPQPDPEHVYAFVTSTAPWYVHRSCIQTVIIGSGVTAIGKLAFAGCAEITDVTIPDGVTSIGDDAFHGCKKLIRVTIPDSAERIGRDAFLHCTDLKEITIGTGMRTISTDAFYGCDALEKVVYNASRMQWKSIDIQRGNDPLLSANRTYRPLAAVLDRFLSFAETFFSSLARTVLLPVLSLLRLI